MLQTIAIIFLLISNMLLLLLLLRKDGRKRKENATDSPEPILIPPAPTKEANEVEGEMDALVLVVEDDAAQRDYVVKALSSEYKIITAENGGEGLDMATSQCPDIVITDINMPIMNGYELCRRFRGNMETSHIAIVMISGMTERENVIYGLESGADDYICKPLDMAVLKARVRNIRKTRQRLQEALSKMDLTEQIDYKSKLDEEFMHRLHDIVEAQLANSDFSVNDLCQEMAMGRSTLFSKLKSITGHSPNDIIRMIRLKKAKELLSSHAFTVSEVAVRVGFADPKYFSTCFKKQFGTSPSKL